MAKVRDFDYEIKSRKELVLKQKSSQYWNYLLSFQKKQGKNPSSRQKFESKNGLLNANTFKVFETFLSILVSCRSISLIYVYASFFNFFVSNFCFYVFFHIDPISLIRFSTCSSFFTDGVLICSHSAILLFFKFSRFK